MTRAAVLAAGLAVALLGMGSGSAAPSENPKLSGTVGPAFTIALEDALGNRVTKLDPGTYDIEVEDLSEFHSFHLEGPGVNRATPVDGTGKETWTVTFQDGTYVYHCDVHPSSMRGSFVAGSPPPPPPPAAITAKTKLLLTSGPDFKITLTTAAGKSFKSMKRGTYTVVVRDRSRLHSAHVIAPGFIRKTGVPSVGSQSWRMKLARVGTLRFFCDAHPASMRGSRKIV